jgi:hypothetical protein
MKMKHLKKIVCCEFGETTHFSSNYSVKMSGRLLLGVGKEMRKRGEKSEK